MSAAFWSCVFVIANYCGAQQAERETTDGGGGLEKNADIIRNIISSNILD